MTDPIVVAPGQEGMFDDPEPEVVPVAPGQEELFEAPTAPGGRPDEEQATLFGADEEFHRAWSEWRGMPEFSQEDLAPWTSIIVNFAGPADLLAFAKLVGQPIRATTRRTQSIWYPKAEVGHFADKRYRDASGDTP